MDVAQRLIAINKTNVTSKVESFSRVERDREQKSATQTDRTPLVLIIDDSVTVRELLSMTFKKAGYRVEQARDGQEAWDKLRDGLECDLAFCDIEMPRMNGLELLLELQQDERLSSLPVAMLTSRGAQKMRNLAAQRGAKGYFVKPYVEDALIEAAEKMRKGEVLIDNLDN
jgi:chemosensory pili system protein ChpA (sensor histidine kinase/response regulator)